MEYHFGKKMNSIVDEIYLPGSFYRSTGNFSFNKERVSYYSLGRFALLEGLKCLNLKRGDTVLLPAFICRDVLAPFNILGLKIKFYHVDKTLSLNENYLPNARAILMVNYFGFPQYLEPFKDYCAKNGAWLIEDNAHGFLSSDNLGNYLGKRGDIGIYSFRKTIPIRNGAALSLNNSLLKFKNNQKVPFETSSKLSMYDFKIKMATLGPLVNGKSVQYMTSLLRKLKKIAFGYEIPPEIDESEFRIEGSNRPAFYSSILSSMDQCHEIERRRSLFKVLEKLLEKFDIDPIFTSLDKGCAPYSYPFICNDNVFNVVRAFLRIKGVDVLTWPALPKEIKSGQQGFYKQVRSVRFLW